GGRPGDSMGSTRRSSAGIERLPARNAAALARVNASFCSGSVAERQHCAAANRQLVGTGVILPFPKKTADRHQPLVILTV
ncbi:MAG TPA: hypothetical protein PLU65_11780, partial [Dokdonella sp.]|nr:hypothetical protein [Dokdonella sp.]